MILTLIGYRATGKTTLARLLAERLGWDWIDADVEIERRAGKSIARIFAEDGEPAFRDLEAQVIADLCRRDRLVLAAGGGAPLRPESRRAMREAGKVVWLTARPETILARMTADATTTARRPNLTDRTPLAGDRRAAQATRAGLSRVGRLGGRYRRKDAGSVGRGDYWKKCMNAKCKMTIHAK